nr:TlpA disulfide reductase family protein [uncultured Draconibacterium sp.]
MKSANILLLFLIFISACKQKESFIIEGTVPAEWETQNVQLKFLDEDLNDSIIIAHSPVKSNQFKMKGSIAHPNYVVLQFSSNKSVYFFLENTTTTIKFSPQAGAPIISGSALNIQLEVFYSQFAPFRQELQKIRDEIVEARNLQKDSPDFLTRKRSQMDTIIQKMVKCQKTFIAEHPNSLATAYILRMSKTDLEMPFVQSVYSNFDDEIKSSSIGKSLKKQITAQEKTALGNSFIDIQLVDVKGKEITISELAENQEYLLLDFWASWCGPCRHENDNILKIHNQYHSKGLQIVGISLDVKKEAWQKAIQEDHITWTQLSDLKGWNSPLVAKYGIEGIPYTVLVNKEGKIVAKGLRGENLSVKLKEVFNN